MTLTGFIARNALRNKRRSILTISSVALSLFLLCTLRTALRELTEPASTEEGARRIAVRHKVSLANLLPAKQRPVIERIPGVLSVTPLSWFGGTYIDESRFFPRFAIDPKEGLRQFAELKVKPEEAEAFYALKTGCIVGRKTMDRLKLKVGDRITLVGDIWPCDVELTIAGTYSGGVDETNLFFNHKYLDEATGGRGQVGCWWVLADRIESVPAILERINQAFANTDAPVLAESERAFQMGFVSMFGNVRVLIGSISTVILFTMLLVAASTMSITVRERFREISILKAVGFQSTDLVALIAAESFLLATAGGVIGCGGAWLLFHAMPIDQATQGFFVLFEVTPAIVAQGMLVAVGLGFVACVFPAWTAARMSVLEGLRTLD